MFQTNSPVDSVYARLTAPGRGAVASIFVCGVNLPADLNDLFRPASGRKLVDCFGLDIIYGRWLDQGQPGEDLVVCPITESVAEIHCHGGDSAVTAIVQSLETCGYRAATNQEFADIRGISRWKSDFERAIQKAITERTSLLLLEMWHSIDDKIEALAELIKAEPNIAAKQIHDIIEWQNFGLHLTKPWSVVLSGKPNVGKSSLINAIVGFERAIVHATAGTTRDVVEQTTAINGWPVQLKDTAGLRSAADQIEVQGVTKARQEVKGADLVVLVGEASEDERPDAIQFGLRSQDCVIVINKSDLHSGLQPSKKELWTSAVTGEGIKELVTEIGNRLVPRLSSTEFVPINMRQVTTLEEVLRLVQSDELAAAAEALRSRNPQSSPPQT